MIRSRSLTPLLFAALLATACSTTSSTLTPSSTSAVEKTFANGIEAFNRHDLDAFVGGFANDVEMYTPTGWVRGHDAVRARFAETFGQFANVRMETESLRARAVDARTVVIDFGWRVYPMGKGPAFHGLSSGVYVSRDGRWVEVLEHETVTSIDAPLPGARR